MFLCNKLMGASLLAASVAALSACGGSGSNDSGTTGRFSMAVTDAPIDLANQVVVEFNGVTIKPADGEAVEFIFEEPKSIDLLTLQGSVSETLVTDEEVPSGHYEWVRLAVNAEQDGVLDSFIELADGTQQELDIPSGGQTGLKLVSGFDVPAGGSADFTVDFDLRKSVVITGNGDAKLKPTLRLIDNTRVGSIAGSVDESLVSAECEDTTVTAGAVYVYSGADIAPTDVAGTEDDPLISALVNFADGSYDYEAGFLSEGSYTIAYTCQAGDDDPETADEIRFVGTATVDVEADSETTHDFSAEEPTTESAE